jgi:transcriptional regulator with XRE-family HTH domain
MSMAAASPQEDPRTPADTFSARLVLLRHDMGLTVDEISSRCGIPSATWSTWERGTKPRDKESVVLAISQGTGYSRDWLMWGHAFPLRAEWKILDGGAVDRAQGVLPFRAPLHAV